MKKWIGLALAVLMVLTMASAAFAEEAKDPIGSVDGNVYTNELFNLRAEFPSNWRILSDSEMASIMGYPQEYASREGLAALLEKESVACALYAAAMDGTNYNTNFMVEKLQGLNSYLSEQNYYALSKSALIKELTSQGFSNINEAPKTFLLGGQEHAGATITAEMGSVHLDMASIFIKADSYMGVLTVGTSSEEATQDVVAMFGSLTKSYASLDRGASDPWTVIGSLCGTGWDRDFPMIEVREGLWTSAPLTLQAGDEFKVRCNGNWDLNYGITDGVCVEGGKNVVVPADGVYVVTLDLNAQTLTFAERTEDVWSVIGTLYGSAWDMDFPMVEISEGEWVSAPLSLKAKDEFKVRLNGDWAINYGELGEFNGLNIVVSEDDVYTVILDLNVPMLTYINENGTHAETNADERSWGVVGSFGDSNWNKDYPMTETASGVWVSAPLEMKAGDEFKVRLNGVWAQNFGITDGLCVQDGGNVVVPADGVYVVTLDLNTLSLTFQAQ